MTDGHPKAPQPADNDSEALIAQDPSSRSFGTWIRTSTLGSVLILAIVAVAVLVAIWAVSAARSKSATEGAGEEAASAGTSTAVEVPDSSAPAPEVGNPAPDFTATDTEGQEINLESLRGKPVWLVFNATWCANCRAELHDVEAAYQEYADQVDIIGIYLSDSEQSLNDYSQRLGLTFPQIADPSSNLGALYRVIGVPTHYFIDADGNIAAIDIGTLSPKVMGERIRELVGS